MVHIQGVASFYTKSYTTQRYTLRDLKRADSLIDRAILKRGNYYAYKSLNKRADIELRIAQHVKHCMGRTAWDKNVSSEIMPNAVYHHCDELMRDKFYNAKWQYHYDGKRIVIASTMSPVWCKGYDVALLTAKALKDKGIDLEWHLYGGEADSTIFKYMSSKEGIKPEDVNIIFEGPVDENTLCEGLLKADVYVHTSYIENSSNAIAEAMLIGLPIAAQNVGGNASMLRDESGILVEPGNYEQMAEAIISLTDKATAQKYSARASEIGNKRNDRAAVTGQLIDIYREIIANESIK